MKPEPLKNKGVIGQYSDYEKFGDSINFKERMFFKSEIKSAVEWLEKKIGESENSSDTLCMSKGELYEWIDEAFEDVTKWK